MTIRYEVVSGFIGDNFIHMIRMFILYRSFFKIIYIHNFLLNRTLIIRVNKMLILDNVCTLNNIVYFGWVNFLHLKIVPVLNIRKLILDVTFNYYKLVSFDIVPEAFYKNSIKLFITNSLVWSNIMKVNTIKFTDNKKLLYVIVREKTLCNYRLIQLVLIYKRIF